ncbi:MAG: MarR family winged helix-turn-helix transcriptional regulator [Synechococcus sp.]
MIRVRAKPIERSPKIAAQASFLPVLRELARTYQAFTRYSDSHVRSMGLTPAQFGAISKLGDTEGMSMQELAKQTLVTKGTLTGIVDRLEEKGLVKREVPPQNRRSFTVKLTAAGTELFECCFPEHIHYLGQRFQHLSDEELQKISSALTTLKTVFES